MFWLDIIIFNVYLFFMVSYLFTAHQEIVTRRKKEKKAEDANKQPSIGVLLLAFVFRYTYLFTVVGMFFLSLSNVTLMNLLYLILFLVFFSSGDTVLIETKKKSVTRTSTGEKSNLMVVASLTTFSRRYWFVIVYYTLACIIVKYVYFLFFYDGRLVESLLPTGINYEYDWAFNFSLSPSCLSNTTPLFIIFVFSEI